MTDAPPTLSTVTDDEPSTPILPFEVARRNKADSPVTVKLDWVDDDGDKHTEEFTAIPSRISTVTLMRLGGQRISTKSDAFFKIIEQAFGEEENQRFLDFAEHPDHEVEAEQLAKIIAELVEHKEGRPTTPSAS